MLNSSSLGLIAQVEKFIHYRSVELWNVKKCEWNWSLAPRTRRRQSFLSNELEFASLVATIGFQIPPKTLLMYASIRYIRYNPQSMHGKKCKNCWCDVNFSHIHSSRVLNLCRFDPRRFHIDFPLHTFSTTLDAGFSRKKASTALVVAILPTDGVFVGDINSQFREYVVYVMPISMSASAVCQALEEGEREKNVINNSATLCQSARIRKSGS